MSRSREYAIRCMHEAKMHTEHGSSFITLTYAEECLPNDGSVHLSHVQKFMKRLRKNSGKKLRFFACGEYGERLSRPHYHLIVFGEDFSSDRYPWKQQEGGMLYRSPFLESCWGDGFSTIGEVTFESAAYVARYIMKKVVGDEAEEHYTVEDHTGRKMVLNPEFVTMSTKPGLGRSWFEKYYKSDVYSQDCVVFENRRYEVPRYYDKLLEEKDVALFERIKAKRAQRMEQNPDHGDWRRLEAREFCQEKRAERLIRPVESP